MATARSADVLTSIGNKDCTAVHCNNVFPSYQRKMAGSANFSARANFCKHDVREVNFGSWFLRSSGQCYMLPLNNGKKLSDSDDKTAALCFQLQS